MKIETNDVLIIFLFIGLLLLMYHVVTRYLIHHHFHREYVGTVYHVVKSTKKYVTISPTAVTKLIINDKPGGMGVEQDIGIRSYYLPKGNKNEQLEPETWYELMLVDDILTLVKVKM
jgi:hypothetical protein